MKYLVFLGSVRDSAPPRPRRLGLRVAKALSAQLCNNSDKVKIIDPMKLDLGKVFKSHFAYAKGKAPEDLERLSQEIEEADGYVMISPEYNHSMSPALAELLNHFGSSSFSYKPSTIVTYSAGQWGGTRAAVNMRTFLSELGCIPVSAMIHIPKAHEVLDEDGDYLEGVDDVAWASYFDRAFAQLNWWATAAANARANDDLKRTKAFVEQPSQRNAP